MVNLVRVKQNIMVLFSVIEKGEYGLLNPITRKLHRINETGKVIWESCNELKDFMDLTHLISRNFEVPEDAVQKDHQSSWI
ncbi:MAG: PqqD family protein [Theionarchaea archaeon]|nr:PqqD family protein [Theionarchaea archaeon]